MMATVKVNYIKDAHNNDPVSIIPKKFKNWNKKTKDMGKYVKHIKGLKDLKI